MVVFGPRCLVGRCTRGETQEFEDGAGRLWRVDRGEDPHPALAAGTLEHIDRNDALRTDVHGKGAAGGLRREPEGATVFALDSLAASAEGV